MKLITKIPIQSFSDIVTNSSSELFTVIDDRSLEEVKELVMKIGKQNLPNSWNEDYNLSDKREFDSFSGVGGEIEVMSWKDLYNYWLENRIPKNKRSEATPEVWSLQYEESLEELKKEIQIKIDENRKITINWILQNLYVIDADGGYFEKDPNTGRVIRSITYEEAKKLPEERRLNF